MSTPIADLVELLLSQNCPGTKIVEAARKMEAAIGNTARGSGAPVPHREKERLRKAAYRLRMSQNVPGQEVATISISKGSKILKSKKKDIAAPKNVPGQKRDKGGTRLPEDWTPDEALYQYGEEKLRLTRPEIAALGEDMRLWAIANAHRPVGRKSNWPATFQGWMRREAAKVIRNRPDGLNGGGAGAINRKGSQGFSNVATIIRQRRAADDGPPEREAPPDPKPGDRY